MCLNDKVIWYVNAMGSASHVFHMHGNGFTYPYNGVNTYATSINAGIGKTLYMNATDRGKWQVICHVSSLSFSRFGARLIDNTSPLPGAPSCCHFLPFSH